MEDKVFVKEGDIIVLNGVHKIYCGDSTKKESYDFMKDEQATMCFTSPPYNVGKNNYEYGKTKKYTNREDDIKDTNEYFNLLKDSSLNALNHCKYLFLNIQCLAGNKIAFWQYMNEMKEYFVDTIIWRKTTTNPIIEPNILNCDFEFINVFKNEKFPTRHIKIGEDFCGTKSNVIDCNRNKNMFADIHKALFPIELCNIIIKNFTNEGDILLDCFSGLGTNLISCNNNGRIYRGIELSPLYCQETIKRFINSVSDYDIQIIRNGEIIPFDDFREYIFENENQLF